MRHQPAPRHRLRRVCVVQLDSSLRSLKAAFPESLPFGIAQDDLLYRAPSWFGSGHDRRLVAYSIPSRAAFDSGPWTGNTEYDAFLDELKEAGAARLIELLNTRAQAMDVGSLWESAPRE